MNYYLNKNSYFRLFSNCRLIKGYSRSAIYDLQREELYQVPNSFFELLSSANSKKIQDIYHEYPEESETLDEYFDFLLSKDLIFLMPELRHFSNFKEIDFNYQYPFSLFSTIIALDNSKSLISHTINVLNNIEETKCKYVQLRLGLGIDISMIKDIINLFINREIFRSISIIISQNDYDQLSKNENLKHSIINKLIVYQNQEDIQNPHKSNQLEPVEVIYINESDFPVFKSLNELRFQNFQPNIISYSEALNHNLYYNKKAYIAPNGDVLQSPFTSKTFGNIDTKSLLSIISNETFQEYWNIPKDKIEVCKDCEFRYVCNDGRIPLKQGKDSYYFEKSCTYDPYNK